MKFTLYTISLTLIILASCSRQKLKNKGCTGTMTVLTSSYNSDSVTFYAPNIYTPNGDGLNDFFQIKGTGIEGMEINIFKGSKIIYSSNDFNSVWDGTYNGTLLKSRIYNYEATLYTIHNESIEVEGKISIMNPIEDKGFKNCTTCIFGDMIDPREGVIYSTQDFIDCK